MLSALAALVVLFLGRAAADDGLSACAAGCITNVFSNPAGLGCATNDKVCVCKAQPDFGFAVRDCITQACSLTGDDLTNQLNLATTSYEADCAAVSSSANTPSATATPSTTSPVPSPPPTTTTEPATTPTTTPTPSPPTTTAAAATTTQPTTTATSTTTASSTTSITKAATTTSSTATPATSTAASTSSSPASKISTTSTSSGATTSAAAASSTTSPDASSSDGSSSSGSLSVAAKAGIGAGAGVALLLSLIIACYIISRKRKAKRSPAEPPGLPPMQISRPLPGSGRQYAHDLEAAKAAALSTHFRDTTVQPNGYSPSQLSSSYSPKSGYAPSRPSRDDDPDVQGRRYEDMVPRMQPRTMI